MSSRSDPSSTFRERFPCDGRTLIIESNSSHASPCSAGYRLMPHRSACADQSEEHTSELQSHHDLVCRLLLEKKKTQHTQKQHHGHGENTEHLSKNSTSRHGVPHPHRHS